MFLFKRNKRCLSSKQRKNLNISDKEYKEYQDTFKIFDKNSNGYIEAHELHNALTMLGESPTQEMVDEMISKADTVRKDNRIEFLEFCQLMKKMSGKSNHEEQCQELFKLIDKDTSGFINQQELALALSRGGYVVSDAEVEATFRKADKTKNGLISFPEFVIFMQTYIK